MIDRAAGALEAAGGWVEAGASLHHVAIAVRDLRNSAAVYLAMGCEAGVEETIEAERVRVLMLGTGGESHVELIEALDGDSTVRRFVERRGEGLHHIALGVEDVEASLAVARERGLRLVRNELGIGAGGRRYFFIHPESAGGVLLEICERGATQTRGEGKELPCG